MSVNPEASFGHRLKQRVLSPFGWRWVPGREVAVIMREEKFRRIERGPREIWLVMGAERVAFSVDVFPDVTRYTAQRVNTADGPQVDVVLQLEFRFEPWTVAEGEQGRVCVRCKTADARREMVEEAAQRAAQTVFSSVSAVVACAGSTSFARLEPAIFDLVDERLRPVALSLLRNRCSIQRIDCPDTLKQRLEKMVERELNIEMVNRHGAEKVGQALRAEAVESLSKMTSGSPYLNVHDLTDMSGLGASQKLPPPQIVDHVPDPRPESTPPSPPPGPVEPDEPASLMDD